MLTEPASGRAMALAKPVWLHSSVPCNTFRDGVYVPGPVWCQRWGAASLIAEITVVEGWLAIQDLGQCGMSAFSLPDSFSTFSPSSGHKALLKEMLL